MCQWAGHTYTYKMQMRMYIRFDHQLTREKAVHLYKSRRTNWTVFTANALNYNFQKGLDPFSIRVRKYSVGVAFKIRPLPSGQGCAWGECKVCLLTLSLKKTEKMFEKIEIGEKSGVDWGVRCGTDQSSILPLEFAHAIIAVSEISVPLLVSSKIFEIVKQENIRN